MMSARQEKTLALAAILQSASLADSVAWRGHCDPVALECSLASLLVFDTDDGERIYGAARLRGLRTGLAALEHVLLPKARHVHPRQQDILRYALALMHLEGKLRHAQPLQQQLRARLQHIQQQRAHFSGLTDPALMRNLAGAYVDTLGTLDFRIQIKGDRQRLATAATQEQVRAILLAGVRAAWHWQRLGGRRWHLIFTRGAVLATLRELIRAAEGKPPA